ncbi:Hypothetical protein DEACI_1933 [Acididesulfobacillus acetoxydans]|uniref:Uncharacterized protein n=1 Tax=Acididesulfobacillus acetoxydans TaxID=1561005 RepID=A0A8S0W7Y4_9FIRM|nr:Hypothetical protein DEACI_1933 [Acididesulfobacillus acetoxydans]CEJ08811.1 Hypothetical protein DEACI_3291 [Acididesulfobacillus acetoxydans]
MVNGTMEERHWRIDGTTEERHWKVDNAEGSVGAITET